MVEEDRGSESTPSTPRWVKVFGIVAVVVLLLVVVLWLTGGGAHGPDRHASSSIAAAHVLAVLPALQPSRP